MLPPVTQEVTEFESQTLAQKIACTRHGVKVGPGAVSSPVTQEVIRARISYASQRECEISHSLLFKKKNKHGGKRNKKMSKQKILTQQNGTSHSGITFEADMITKPLPPLNPATRELL